MENAERIEPIDIRRENMPNHAFIGAEMKLDEVIEALQVIRRDHLHMGEKQKNWAEAGEAVAMVNRLVNATNMINGHSEG